MDGENNSMQDAADETAQGHRGPSINLSGQPSMKTEQQRRNVEEDEDDEGEAIEEDSDSDIDIITERKPGASRPEPSQPLPRASEAIKIEQPRPTVSESRSKAVQPPQTKAGTPIPQQPQKPGHEYPEVHTSNIDFDADPVYPPAGKPITEVDFDADLAEHDKPWRRPGSDQTEFFNYGFDEFTWATYCLKQATMRAAINDQKAESAKFEMMFGGGGGMPGMPAPQAPQQQQAAQMPQGMQGAAGMPDMNPDMMNAMAQQMMATGMDPSQMDFGSFMQQFQNMQGGNGGGGGGVPTGPQGFGGQGQGMGGGFGGNAMLDGAGGGQGGGRVQGGNNFGGRGRGRRW